MNITNLSANLLKQLNEIAVENQFIDFDFKCESGSKDGNGFIASIISVIIYGNKNQLNGEIKSDELALICKIVPTNEARRELFNSEKIFSNEIFAYNNVLPALMEFQQEKGIQLNVDGFIQFPRAYRAIFDADHKQHFIIMENIRTKGYEIWNKLEPITREHVQLIMISLGRYHGLSFALRDQKPEIFNSFRPLPDLFLELSKESNMIKNMLVSAIDKGIGLFVETAQEFKILLKLKNEFLEILEKCSGDNVAEPFSVINHGDSWNNNFMFKGTKEICLLDWQFIRIASPVLDLSYFLMSSTTKELRDQYFDEFIQIYYENLAGIIRKCGSDPEHIFTFSNLQDEFKKFGQFGLLLSSFLINIVVTDTEDLLNMDEYSENAHQNCGSLDFVKVNEKNDGKLRKRLGDAIRDAITYGWIEP